MVGAAVLAVGLGFSAVGGAGELAYYQCVASTGPGCTSAGNNQYITVFLANNDLMIIGMNILLIGILILLAGILTMYMPLSIEGIRPLASPTRQCTKCGAQVEASHKFCGACGNSLT